MDYKKAANHWVEKDKTNVSMPEERLCQEIKAYLSANNTCALATGSGEYIRCTPVEYSFHDSALWIFSEGGKKFIGLETNKNVSAAVFDKYQGFGQLKGMQIHGKAYVVEPFSEEYIQAADFKGIPVEALKKLPEPMNLIKIVPVEIDLLNSDFKKDGFASRQSMTFC